MFLPRGQTIWRVLIYSLSINYREAANMWVGKPVLPWWQETPRVGQLHKCQLPFRQHSSVTISRSWGLVKEEEHIGYCFLKNTTKVLVQNITVSLIRFYRHDRFKLCIMIHVSYQLDCREHLNIYYLHEPVIIIDLQKMEWRTDIRLKLFKNYKCTVDKS